MAEEQQGWVSSLPTTEQTSSEEKTAEGGTGRTLRKSRRKSYKKRKTKRRRTRKKRRRKRKRRRTKRKTKKRRKKRGGNDFDDCKKYPTQGEILECRLAGGVKAYNKSKKRKHFSFPKFKSFKTKDQKQQKKEQDLIDSMDWSKI